MFGMDFCCAVNGAFSQCVQRATGPTTVGDPDADPGYDFSGWDADNGGAGILEVAFRLEENVQNLGLSLWYGNYPRRKRLVLLSAAESAAGLGPQTLVRYFTPDAANCPQYHTSDLSDPHFVGFPPECIAQGNAQGIVCANGRWTNIDPNCLFDFSNSWLYLTAESCGATVQSTVTLVSVRFFEQPGRCICIDDGDCDDAQCHTGPSIPGGLCSPASTSCEGEGQQCTITVGGQTCTSNVICASGQPVCPASCG